MNEVVRPEDEQFTADELQEIERRAAELRNDDYNRYVRVMAEIEEDERKTRQRLREILTRKAVVMKAGHR